MNPLAVPAGTHRTRALLALENGRTFAGWSFGAPGEAFGEVVFNTSMVGYQEVVTDPSYAGQIVCLTYPQVGNYGINAFDMQAESPALSALVVSDACYTPSHWQSACSLPDYLQRSGVVAIEGVDTRALTLCLREEGAMKAAVSTVDLDPASLVERVRLSAPISEKNLVAQVSCAEPFSVAAKPVAAADKSAAPAAAGQDVASQDTAAAVADKSADKPAASDPAKPFYVVAVDCGEKAGIMRAMSRAGIEATVVPWDTPASEILALGPDGVFFSNGPGDPEAVPEVFATAGALLGKLPVFGICLGNQVLSLAAGAQMEKLAYGHHGGNEPVMNLLTGRVEVTAQNHNYGPVFSTLGPLVPELSGGYSEHVDDLRFWSERRIAPVVDNPRFGRIRLTHVNLNDGTPEGLQFLDVPAFSMQYHPEAKPGPNDALYAFGAFARLMAGDPDYLAVDIAERRRS